MCGALACFDSKKLKVVIKDFNFEFEKASLKELMYRCSQPVMYYQLCWEKQGNLKGGNKVS